MLRSFFDVNTVRVAEYGRVRTWLWRWCDGFYRLDGVASSTSARNVNYL